MSIGDDTPIMVEVVADCVISESERLFDHTFSEAERTELIAHLTQYGENVYAHNVQFAKKIRAKGNMGRDTLYAFNRHWLAAFLRKDARFSGITYKVSTFSFQQFANGVCHGTK